MPALTSGVESVFLFGECTFQTLFVCGVLETPHHHESLVIETLKDALRFVS